MDGFARSAVRLVPAAESGLLGSAEVPLAILFAWLILAELPTAASVTGGAVVLGAVLAHAARDYVRASNGKAERAGPPKILHCQGWIHVNAPK